MTDGSIVLDDDGRETKCFHVRDGLAIKLWQRLGFRTAIITGRDGRVVAHRARELGIDLVAQGSADKGSALVTLAAAAGVHLTDCGALGDDWPDLPMLRRVGYPMAVGDADPRVKAAAAFVTATRGGRGAVREVIEHLISSKGLMDRALALYDT
ncbi:MAG: HAD hydrolase family protein [Phycisphaerales bacterium]|nr:HAD hydrolase family protein [Phycisphaerales bacterium]